MTLQLLLLRHAKSDWNAEYGGDHERPLNDRGRRHAAVMGRFVAAADLVPDLVLCSTAVRASSTLEEARRAGGWSGDAVEVRPVEGIYGGSVGTVIELLRRLHGEDRAARVMVVGHEPTMSSLVSTLTGCVCRYPTACLAVMQLAGDDWRRWGKDRCELVMLAPPRAVEALERRSEH